ncbi:sporulation protein YpjB [Evansella sp. AB-P1]|uniref:sporulation protein YpjB n=1 Tax=Evansella sp. AB-P1 TaxID=3037653 RepID=UPI00241E6C73|nr:sporulation protein YpjB [Evansella sp. AB-P1]MDG5787576.1 sporulation protein YpjB [Evansella sp. AB-P1]
MAGRFLKILIILSILTVTSFHIGQAEEVEGQKDIWRELNHTTDTILRYVKEGHYEEAKQLLNDFSEQFLTIRASEHNLSMSELHVITAAYEDVLEATTNVSLSHEARVQKASKLRILVDVYDASHEPLWKQTRGSLFNPLEQMEEMIKSGNPQAFQRELNRFLDNYETVRPAWSVDLPYESYQKMDSQVQFLKKYRNDSLNKEVILKHLTIMQGQLTEIFDGEQDEVSDPSLIWVMLTIGGSILLSLTYAGWKIYRADKEKEKTKKRNKRYIP